MDSSSTRNCKSSTFLGKERDTKSSQEHSAQHLLSKQPLHMNLFTINQVLWITATINGVVITNKWKSCPKTTDKLFVFWNHPLSIKKSCHGLQNQSLRGEGYRPPLDTNSSAETEQQDPMEQDSCEQLFPHKYGLFARYILSDTQLLFSDTGSWKQANHNKVSLTGLFKPYYLATEHWAIPVPNAQGPYKIFQGNWILIALLCREWAMSNVSTMWKLWAILADRAAFPTDCTGQSCINEHKTTHISRHAEETLLFWKREASNSRK